MPTILLADDDPHITELLNIVFTSKDYMVLTCDGGQEAIEMAERVLPDLVVLDAMMPRVDGYQVLWHLRDRELTKDIPVIMLTSRSTERDVEFGYRLGATDYIAKPFSAEDLLSRASKLLQPPKTEDVYDGSFVLST